MSVLEFEREISRETLQKYLPAHQSSQMPALLREAEHREAGFSERDILYKVLFDMKKDMTELKKLVYELLQGDNYNNGDEVLKDHQDLFSGVSKEKRQEPIVNPHLLLENGKNKSNTIELDKVEDIVHETEEDSLSLEKKEKEMILRALRKNRNKRKYAAQDLGISERTLYRKIKQYEIE
jgi:transcriptional regulator with GAF, ATPase, and Fis domain